MQLPDVLLQGACRLRRDHQGHRVRVRHRRLRLDGQPRQLDVAAHAAQAGHPLLRDDPARSRAGQSARLADLRPDDGPHPRELRRREPPLHRDRRQVRLGDRQREPAAVLHRRRQDLRLRDRRAARLETAAAHRRPDRRRDDPAQDLQGVPGVHRARPGRGQQARRSTPPRRRGAIRSSRRSRRAATSSSRRSPTRSPRASRSAIRPTGITSYKVVQRVRRLGRERHRPRDRRRDQAAGQDRRHLDRARRRHDARRDDQADRAGPDSAG